MNRFISFTKKELEAVTMLSIGTFLEYFDFFLYIHLATLLNTVFFAPTDEKSTALLTSFAYCTSYIFRPIGAVIFGYIGDKYGRKATINISLLLMGVSCLGIFFLPSYEQIGVVASFMITILRALQSITTMTEILSGEIYLVEFTKGKKTFLALGLLGIGCFCGGQSALHAVDFALKGWIDYKLLFLFGLFIFLIRSYTVRNIDEPSVYMEAKIKDERVEPLSLKTTLAVYAVNALQSVTWFVCCVGLNGILQKKFGYSDTDIISNNIFIFYTFFGGLIVTTILAQFIEPSCIIIFKANIANILFLLSPIILFVASTAESIIAFQCILLIFASSDFNVSPYVYKSTPILKRVRINAMAFALSRAFVTALTGFGIVLIEPYTGIYTYLILGVPFSLAYCLAVYHFTFLDKQDKKGYHTYYQENKI